jgi:hypothetical protein
MDIVRTEKKNGYEIHVKVVRVHPGKRVKRAASALDDGYVLLVEIARGGESYAQWHRSKCCKSRDSRDEAEDDALTYATRLVERRPFDGLPSGADGSLTVC